MSQAIYRAIMRDGVAVPVEPFDVADGTEVLVSIPVTEGDIQSEQNQKEIFEILLRSRSLESQTRQSLPQ